MRHLFRAALSISLCASTWASGAAVEMRLLMPAVHLQTANDGLHQWADSITLASGARLRLRPAAYEDVGGTGDTYAMVRDGVVDAGWVVQHPLDGRFPILGVFDLPFLARAGSAGSLAFDTWYRRYARSEMEGVHYCLGVLDGTDVLHTRRAVRSPDDVRGMRLATAVEPGDLIDLAGARHVAVGDFRLREALRHGAIDGAAMGWRAAVRLGVATATVHHISEPLRVRPMVYVINKHFYQQLPPPLRKVIDSHCTSRWAALIADSWAGVDLTHRSLFQGIDGHRLMTLGPAHRRQWQLVAAPLMARWREQVARAGADPEAALLGLQRLLLRHDAAY